MCKSVNLIKVKQNIWINLWKEAKIIFCCVFIILGNRIRYAVNANVIIVWQKSVVICKRTKITWVCLKLQHSKGIFWALNCVKVICICLKLTCISCINTQFLILSCWCARHLRWFVRDMDWMCIQQFSKIICLQHCVCF